MLSYCTSHLACSNLSHIDQEFFEPCQTHLECDSDHTQIEQAKKTSDILLKTPEDWTNVVRCERAEIPMVADEMKKEELLNWGVSLKQVCTKRGVGTRKFSFS